MLFGGLQSNHKENKICPNVHVTDQKGKIGAPVFMSQNKNCHMRKVVRTLECARFVSQNNISQNFLLLIEHNRQLLFLHCLLP